MAQNHIAATFADMADRIDFDEKQFQRLVCAALTGITANSDFFCRSLRQEPAAAAEFAWLTAMEVVRLADQCRRAQVDRAVALCSNGVAA